MIAHDLEYWIAYYTMHTDYLDEGEIRAKAEIKLRMMLAHEEKN